MRWLNIPVSLVVHDVKIESDFDTAFQPDSHIKAFANIYTLVPGLQAENYRALCEAMEKMKALAATEANNLERVRLCQRILDCWQNFDMPRTAALRLREYYAAHSIAQEQT